MEEEKFEMISVKSGTKYRTKNLAAKLNLTYDDLQNLLLDIYNRYEAQRMSYRFVAPGTARDE